MRIRSMAVILGMALCAAGPLAASGSGSGFERLKSLEGTWRGKAPDGAPVTVTYKVIAAGSAVMEQLSVENMITVYHADGDNLMLTHYCAGNNQPRMRASAAGQDGSVLSFHFVDATNLAGPDAMHMSDLTIRFVDADHFSQEWTHRVGGKPAPMVLAWERVK